jgi:hypothetical protein
MDNSDSDIPPILVTEDQRPTPGPHAGLKPWSSRWWKRFGGLGFLVPVAFVIIGAPAALQAPINPYDGGWLLTLSRFTSVSMLPYRDLGTMYGPGPPIYGSIIMDLFGRGTLPVRLGFLAVQAALALVVFLLARRFVGQWVAGALAVPIGTIAASQSHFHFAWSVLLVLWGIWFVVRSGERPERQARLLAIGALFMGLSFWGRYEFAPFAFLLVVLTWWWRRPHLGRSGRWVLAAGLTPPILFGACLLGIVGMERVWLDLIEYPARYYPRSECRGLPPVWGAAWDALLSPWRGRIWTGHDVILGLGTLGAPLVAIAALGSGALRLKERDTRGLAMALSGCCVAFVWLEHRARAGAEPEPIWAPMMISIAMLISLLRSQWVRGLILGLLGALIIPTIITSWAPRNLPALTTWPRYDRLYGFANLEETFLFDRQKWERLTRVVHRYAGPDEPVFVVLNGNTGHFANMPVFYWVVDRRPGSRYIGFQPCLTDRAPVQREIVRELADTDVIIQVPYFAQSAPPFAPPSTVLDDYLRDHFDIVHEDTVLYEDDIRVLLRRGSDGGTR